MEEKTSKRPGGKAILLIVLVVILALLVAALFIVKHHNSKTSEDESADSSQTMMSFDVTKVSSFSYVLNGTQYTYEKTSDGQWVWTGDETVDLSEDNVEAMLYSINNLTTQNIVADSLDTLSDYGLTSPAFSVTVNFTDGTMQRLYAGSSNPMTSLQYAYLEGGKQIFTIDASVVSSFKTPTDLTQTNDDSSGSSSSADSSAALQSALAGSTDSSGSDSNTAS